MTFYFGKKCHFGFILCWRLQKKIKFIQHYYMVFTHVFFFNFTLLHHNAYKYCVFVIFVQQIIIYELFIESWENKNKLLAMGSSSRYLTSLKAFLEKWKNSRNIKFLSQTAHNAFFNNIIFGEFYFLHFFKRNETKKNNWNIFYDEYLKSGKS